MTTASNMDRKHLGNTLEISRPSTRELEWLTPAQELDAVRNVTILTGQKFCLATPNQNTAATIERSRAGNPKARITGVLPCGLMTCPNCARRLRASKAVEVELLCANLLTEPRTFNDYKVSRTLHMVTLTVSHHAHEPLEKVMERLQVSSKRLLSGRMGTGWRELGLELVSRSLEVTYGKNGWHPHLHLIVSTSPLPLGTSFTPEAQAADLFMGMNRAWVKLTGAGDAGFRADAIHGQGTIGKISGYVAGVRQAARGAALEGIRHDLKRGRHNNISIFELPALLVSSMSGEQVSIGGHKLTTHQLKQLWNEWEQAARGVHQVSIRGFANLRPTRDQVAERLHDLTVSPSEEATTWEPVKELTDQDLRLMRRYGCAPVLKAAALHGERGATDTLRTYAERWEHEHMTRGRLADMLCPTT